jgi:uncharacterized SAM-binding protein YcdF (DUF218 family)
MTLPAISESPTRRSRKSWLVRVFAAFVAIVAVFLIVSAVRVARQAELDETRPAGAIIVFGAAEYSGRPSPVFRARLDHAYELFTRGVAPIVIITGGAGGDPLYNEGGVGRDYLLARGIPDYNLIAETQTDDTAEQAERTAAIMRTNGIKDAVAVSDAYHLFRIKQLMKAQGVTVYGAPRSASVPRNRWGRIVGLTREAISYLFWKLHIT